MRFLRPLLSCVCAVLLLSACAGQPAVTALPDWQSPEGREAEQLGQIVELATGRVLTPQQLIEQLAGTSRLLIGERHDNPDHHALQHWLLENLAAREAYGSLLLEMLDPEQQARVDATRAALVRGEAPDLPAALAWQPGWDWAQYGALVDWALRQPAPLLAANLDREEIRRIYQEVPPLAGEHSTADAVRTALLAQIRASHCDRLPETRLPAMLAVQQQRDRRMAERLLAAPAPAVLIAGAFHARRDLGVPLHLADLGATQAVRVLLLAEVGERFMPGSADYLWYTPAVVAVDHCAQWRAERQTKKDPAGAGSNRD